MKSWTSSAYAIPVYSQWFGNFPYPQFTVVESFFGWNGNECAGLVMIDERVFGMPHLGRGYVEYLVSHETCHQWWYNLVGTNGYAEPFMDEGAAAYFTHRMLDRKLGRNNPFMAWPKGLEWLPNIRRENYRYSGVAKAVRNDEMMPAAQELPKYGHLFGLFTGAYDRGAKVYGMIEAQLGEAAFLDFIRSIVAKYGFRVLQIADLRRELEAYTGRDQGQFFDRWVYGRGLTDWQLGDRQADAGGTDVVGSRRPTPAAVRPHPERQADGRGNHPPEGRVRPSRPTWLVSYATNDGFPLRIPVGPCDRAWADPERGIRVEPAGDRTLRVTFPADAEPVQIVIDPDGVLLDAHPADNRWKNPPNARLTPLVHDARRPPT